MERETAARRESQSQSTRTKAHLSERRELGKGRRAARVYLGVEEAIEGHAGLEGAVPRAVALALGRGRVVLEGVLPMCRHG